jgi:transglutaminase-like putative cysteine protease
MENFRAAGALLVQAGPVMLLLFFLFPRVSGPLWGLPQDAFAAVTGLSDTMSPGSISQLSQSDAIAFRVKFDGSAPPRPQLYWRGPVFWQFDGRTWRAAGLPRLQRAVQFEALGASVDYEITLEPHNRQWLFALDLPARLPPNTRVTSDYILLSVPPIRSRMRYKLLSYPSYRTTAGAEREDFRTATAFPREVNPRAQNLAREWRRSLGNNEAIVRQAIDFLRAGKYGYTLLPPLLGMHTVDEFLFDTKEGFCEHFAGSFVFLMRAAGVPARIVTGYQGGEINLVDGYMVVRQTDAHAWAEVWLENRGWVRVDPTAAAVPLRVNAGIAAAAPRGAPLLMRTSLDWLRSLRDNWDALEPVESRCSGNPDRQRMMACRRTLVLRRWQSFWTVTSVLGVIALWMFARYRPADPTQRIWLAFCRKLGRVGVPRSDWEGPLAFSERAAARLPARANAVRAIAGLYVELRYGRAADSRSMARFRSLVRAFQP